MNILLTLILSFYSIFCSVFGLSWATPYDPADTVNTQYYVIDGFIVSPNVTVDTVETLDFGFRNSDHNPVCITVSLG